jgi:hypothetical protein
LLEILEEQWTSFNRGATSMTCLHGVTAGVFVIAFFFQSLTLFSSATNGASAEKAVSVQEAGLNRSVSPPRDLKSPGEAAALAFLLYFGLGAP